MEGGSKELQFFKVGSMLLFFETFFCEGGDGVVCLGMFLNEDRTLSLAVIPAKEKVKIV